VKQLKAIFKVILTTCFFLVFTAACSSSSNIDSNQKNQKAKLESKEKVELTVSAAASLQDALTEIGEEYQKIYKNVDLKFNFGSSGTLKQQIEQGAPVDLFFSAAEDKFDALVKEGEIDRKEGVDLVSNDLVLIVPKESKETIKDFSDLPKKVLKISLGTPNSVPAGDYAKQTLKNLNIWNEVSNKVVYAKDVRQVLSYVETGNVDAGIVYKTDALMSQKIKMVTTADKKTHDPIIYPVGIIKDSKHTKEARSFYKFLQGEQAMKILEKYGFKSIEEVR
jgi:molybdate transport system substrate-binding protein